MKSYELLLQLISLVEKFENEKEREISLSDFTGFLINQVAYDTDTDGVGNSDVRFGEHEQTAQDLAFKIDNNISRLLIFMYRYAKSYVKKALEDTPLQTAEDFTCLAILLTHKDLSKTELINHNIQEKTSGSAVISRLIKEGLIIEWADEIDKRGKRISITEAGKALLYRVFEQTSHVGKIITGKLTLKEKLILQHLLQKLEDFHYPIHDKKMINTKDDLAEFAMKLVK